MKVLKKEMIYECEIDFIDSRGRKKKVEIKCNDKGELKSATGLIPYGDWQRLAKQVKDEFFKKDNY